MHEHDETDSDTLFKFPCDFPIKAVGRAERDFDALVASIVRRHAPDLSEGAIKVRPSKGGRYMAVTVTIRAVSKQQLDAIYMELSAHHAVMMAL
jgi:putative lipoic acid-binding regulatory protein